MTKSEISARLRKLDASNYHPMAGQLSILADAVDAIAQPQVNERLLKAAKDARHIMAGYYVEDEYVELVEAIKEAESAAPGENLEAELAEALRHTFGCFIDRCSKCRSAQELLARFDAREVKSPKLVTVCDKCLRASCWQGIFPCDESRHAGVIQKTRKQLRILNLESSDYWKSDLEQKAPK